MDWKEKYTDCEVIKAIVLKMTMEEFLDWIKEGSERDAYWIEENLKEVEMYEHCCVVRDYRNYISG